MQFNVSGQVVIFPLISAISGNYVVGASGAISGQRFTGTSGPVLISGVIGEFSGQGVYYAQLTDMDTSGRQISYWFRASGCVPVNIFVETTLWSSGVLYPASGVNTVVPPASLSGLVANSGLFVSVPVASVSGVNAVVPAATLSGLVANSGLNVVVPPASLSGVVANSGLYVVVPTASLSGVVANSGLNVVVPPASISGVYAASGVGAYVPPATLSGLTVASGGFVTLPIASISGVSVTATVTSGQVWLASGSLGSGSFASGLISVLIPTSLLAADMSGTVPATHSLMNAVRKLVNKWDTTTNSGFLTVFKEDATTQAFTQALSATSGAQPVTSLGDA